MPAVRGLYAILDHPHAAGLPLLEQLQAVIAGAGAELGMCQLRAKRASTAERVALLEPLGAVCAAAGVPLVVNDDVEAALAGVPGVTGLHLGQGDAGFDALAAIRARGRLASLGLSTHDLVQLRAAIVQAPDYVAFGPVARTRSKADPDPVVGFGGLADACRISPLPVVAIGGLDVAGAARAIAVGAASVAVIAGLVAADAAGTAAAAQAYAVAIAQARRTLSVDEVHARIPVLSPQTLEQIARWADDLAVLAGLRLPARFRPELQNGEVRYRPSDVCDLLAGLGKRDDEGWDDWRARGEIDDDAIVMLRLGR